MAPFLWGRVMIKREEELVHLNTRSVQLQRKPSWRPKNPVHFKQALTPATICNQLIHLDASSQWQIIFFNEAQTYSSLISSCKMQSFFFFRSVTK